MIVDRRRMVIDRPVGTYIHTYIPVALYARCCRKASRGAGLRMPALPANAAVCIETKGFGPWLIKIKYVCPILHIPSHGDPPVIHSFDPTAPGSGARRRHDGRGDPGACLAR